MQNLSKEQAGVILKTEVYDKFNIGDLPLSLQDVSYNMYTLRPASAKVALKGQPDSVEQVVDTFLADLKKNAPTWDIHGEGWSNRLYDIAETNL